MNSAFCGFVWPAKLVEKARGPFIYYVSIYRGDGVIKFTTANILMEGRRGGRALCVQMDFMRTFGANTKCSNIN